MSEPNIERARALLRMGRVADALAAAREVLAGEPDNVDAALLAGTCLVKLDRTVDAEHLWQQLTGVHPADIDVAVLGVRCAWNRPKELWSRAERLHTLDPNNTTVLFCYALAAARTRHRRQAWETLARLQAVDPVGDVTRRTEVWIDLIMSEQDRRPALVAERIVSELLAENPTSAEAHDLRVQAARVRSSRLRRRRTAALAEIDAIRDAATAGVQPRPGRLRELAAVAIGDPWLGFYFAAVVYLGAIAVSEEVVSWTLAALLVAVTWTLLWFATWRRIVRLVRRLPAIGRQRLLRRVVRSGVITGAVLCTIGIAALLHLRPYDESRATEFGFGKRTEIQTVIHHIDIPVRVPASPLPRTGQPIPVITAPPLPTSREIRTEAPQVVFNPAVAVELIRFYTASAALAIAASSGLFHLAHLAHHGRSLGLTRRPRSRSNA